MAEQQTPSPRRRADAERNREKILEAARAAFADASAGEDVSMAEISRRAEVGMATLYRNFPGRRELLEGLYAQEVDGICAAADDLDEGSPAANLDAWARRFADFFASKHDLATELLTQADRTDPVFTDSRARVLAAGRPLLDAAQAAGEVRDDLTLEQILDMVVAISGIRGDADYSGPILRAALDGIRRQAAA